MAKRSLTPAEQLVGRRLPKEPSYRDLLLSRFLRENGEPCARFEPDESWLKPVFRKLRKAGLVRSIDSFSINGSRPLARYMLTERGLPEARAAVERSEAAREARRQWSRDFIAKRDRAKSDTPTPSEDSPDI